MDYLITLVAVFFIIFSVNMYIKCNKIEKQVRKLEEKLN